MDSIGKAESDIALDPLSGGDDGTFYRPGQNAAIVADVTEHFTCITY